MIRDVSPFVQRDSATPSLPSTAGGAALACISSAHADLRLGRHTMLRAYEPLEDRPEQAA
jgi:hypothetical protein